MSTHLRHEQCCSEDGCTRPMHIGSLCAPCWMAASPARRQVELDGEQGRILDGLVDGIGERWLLDVWER